MSWEILPSSRGVAAVRSVARSHRQTAEKLSTRLSSPLPRPMPTMASTDSPRVRIGGSGYPYKSLFPTNELALNLAVPTAAAVPAPVRLARRTGMGPERRL
uniref:Uncharacterized protein n=1 Tax=Arundo donax TaxID=35708 RepID=A0A0A9GP24_ARUDO